MKNFLSQAVAPIDPLGFAFFRICLGCIMVWEAWRYLAFGWALDLFSSRTVHFPFDWFPWVAPPPGDGIIWVFLLLGLSGLLVAVGFLYRIACLTMCLTLTYVFLIDKANYLNHIYLVCMINAMMCLIPAHKIWSLDSRWRKKIPPVKKWHLWMLIAQLGIVYTFAGIAKIKYDWLVAGHPMEPWLAEHSETPLIGWIFLERPVVMVMAWTGMLLDLFVVPALLWARTKPFAIGFLVVFHLSNAFLFNIGIFPWTMLAATTLFLDPGWLRKIKPLKLGSFHPPTTTGNFSTLGRVVTIGLCLHFAIQLFLPVRHFLIPGDVNWTKEGSRFAWRMKLNRRKSDLRIYVTSDQYPQRQEIYYRELLNRRQASKLSVWPDMVQDFAYLLKEQYEKAGFTGVKVFASSVVSLNNRPEANVFDPEFDLTSVPKGSLLGHKPFLILKPPEYP